MSTDYYTRLEQARGPRPSPAILGSLGRALRLTEDENDHLFLLADQAPPVRRPSDRHVGPGLMFLLNRLDDTPATVISDIGDVLVQNEMSLILQGDARQRTGLDANLNWGWFTDPQRTGVYSESERAIMSRNHVADLRATAARRAGDPDVEKLIAALTAASEEFTGLWEQHEVAVRRHNVKRVVHPEVGQVDLICETLLTPRADQRLLVFLPQPGTDAREKLDLLRVIGTQQLTS